MRLPPAPNGMPGLIRDAPPRGVARLVLVRHVETGSPVPLLAGRTDVDITPTGRAQLERLRAAVSALPRFDALYTSPAPRARRTAEALSGGHLGPALVREDLHEIDCGALDGRPILEVMSAYPELWRANEAQEDEGFRWPGGESYEEMRQRAVGAASAIAAAHPGRRVLIVSHTGFVSQIVGALNGTPAARWSAHRAGNASITVVDWGGNSAELRVFDLRDHLGS